MSALSLRVDPDMILTQLLVGAVPGVAVTPELRADWSEHLPCARVYTAPASAVDLPEAQQRALVQLDVWASGRRQAGDLARDLVAALLTAQRDQRVVPAGHVRRLALVGGPAVVPADPDEPRGIYRFSAQLTAIFRPAPTPTT